MLALFESDHSDTAQLQALDEQDKQQHETVGNAIRQAIVEMHDTLTPEQRKIVADYVRAHLDALVARCAGGRQRREH